MCLEKEGYVVWACWGLFAFREREGGGALSINANNPVEIFECIESNEHFFINIIRHRWDVVCQCFFF